MFNFAKVLPFPGCNNFYFDTLNMRCSISVDLLWYFYRVRVVGISGASDVARELVIGIAGAY